MTTRKIEMPYVTAGTAAFSALLTTASSQQVLFNLMDDPSFSAYEYAICEAVIAWSRRELAARATT